MNYSNACNILDLSDPFSDKDLKHNYYLKALKYHPDKNNNIEAKHQFQEILDAYNYLNNSKKVFKENDNDYFNILEKFINVILDKNIDINKFLSILNNKYTEISVELLVQLPKNMLLKFHKFVDQYRDILHINKSITNKLEELIKEYTKNDITIILNPSLENLVNDEIYKISIKDETYYIPLWHHELVYELSSNFLIVKCEPNLENYINLDQYNNMYVNLSSSIQNIINNTSITINILNHKYIIPVNELYIKKYQRYTIKNKGISLIDINNIYNVVNRANIFIDIHLTDIS